jgi:hypothetical protein
MNERMLKELALQSANEIADLFSPGFFDDRMVNDVAEINRKFAELIVRECAGVCENYRGTEYGKAAECIGDAMKEHFGVE